MSIKSSFHGEISEIPGISVDNFEPQKLQSQAFFLSHCHTDHTKGLYSSALLQVPDSVFVYTSELTKAVIADESCDENLLKRIVPLPLGPKDLTLPKCFGFQEKSLRVTLIRAGHCLGSVMFLFETTDKTVLYTGDFNLRANDVKHIQALHRNKQPIFMDAIYVDTTFLHYDSFPKRSAVIAELLDIMKNFLEKDERNRIGLSTSAKYGYEFIFNEIKEKLKMDVYVNSSRWNFYRDNPGICKGITNLEDTTKIHVCCFRPTQEHKGCVTKTEGLNFLMIRFSAMAWSQYGYNGKAIEWVNNAKLNVCFATHCCREQILNFVYHFPHNKVVGFPNKFFSNSPMKSENCDIVVTPKKRKISSPAAKKAKIVDKKVSKEVLRKIFE